MNSELRKLKEFLEKELLKRNENQNSEYVGELPVELIKMSKSIKREKERLKQDVELMEHQLLLAVARKMEEAFEDRADKLAQKHNDLWQQIYSSMMVDPQKEYYHENGSLYCTNQSRKDESLESLFDFTKPKN